MAITSDEAARIDKGIERLDARAQHDTKCLSYYEGVQTLEHIGLAVPKELSNLQLVVNWPRLVVDTIEERQDIKNIIVPGEPKAAQCIQYILDANDLDAELSSWKRDRLIYGRAYLSVGVDVGGEVIVAVESPREVLVKHDLRTRRVEWALRVVRTGDEADSQEYATLFTDRYRVTAQKKEGRWVELERNYHSLGLVPVIPSYNRRMTGEYVGHSEMADISTITDANVRALTDLQAAVETNAIPKRIITGAKASDFEGNLDAWYNYLSPFLALSDSSARAFSLDAASLSNFHDTVAMYGKLAASVTGFPARYFGITTANPPTEGAIRAEEAKLVKRVERVNAEAGIALAEALRIAANISGFNLARGSVNIVWHDPATPTFSQKADALQKLAGGKPLVSRQGAWDELGWDEARKTREAEYFKEEASDPELQALEEKIAAYDAEN